MPNVSSLRLQDCLNCQVGLLEDVSRTFALTIPQLPKPLRDAVGNAYLLCRIADTIEDETDLTATEKTDFSERLITVIDGTAEGEGFARDLAQALSVTASQGEHDLVANSVKVFHITRSLPTAQRDAILRCVRIMAHGMMEFQRKAGTEGLENINSMNRYCYVVAGVVGEMLTELFCEYSSVIDLQRDRLLPLSVSFGTGLQMTNILKDMWDDRKRGTCWLPKDVFEKSGVNLGSVAVAHFKQDITVGIRELVALARQHLNRALHYILLIPANEVGIRRHCLWALGMATLTLRRIYNNPRFATADDVKISRSSVRAVTSVANLSASSDMAIRCLFNALNFGLPSLRHNV